MFLALFDELYTVYFIEAEMWCARIFYPETKMFMNLKTLFHHNIIRRSYVYYHFIGPNILHFIKKVLILKRFN